MVVFITKVNGKKIILVPFKKKHLENPSYLSWLRDYDVMKYIGREEYLKPIPFEEVKKYVENVWNDKYSTFWAILTDDNKFIGTIKLSYKNEEGYKHRVIELGILIGEKSEWGKGYGTDALMTACHYCFDKLSARKIVAGLMEHNISSYNIFRKVGFVEEARFRKKIFFEGKYCDHMWIGLFKEEIKDD